MKPIRIIVTGLFAVSLVLLVLSSILHVAMKDRTTPVIDCPETPLRISVYENDEAKLLEGVTAQDEKDGDLTDRILVQSVGKSASGSSTTVTYVVADSDNHVTSCVRKLEYLDYAPPTFSLSEALVYQEGTNIKIRDRLTASSVIDGNLSGLIKIISNGVNGTIPGTYPVTFEVTDSLGNTSSVSMDVTVLDKKDTSPRIELSEYIVYCKSADEFSPAEYLDSVSRGSLDNVEVQMPEGGLKSGPNTVVYTCRDGENVGSVSLCVIVE